MALKLIRLELARTRDFPEGSPAHGYEFVAPLTEDGHLDAEAWKTDPGACTLRRFWGAEEEEHGQLIRTRGGRWAFSYAPGDEDDEPIFRFESHQFREGEYITITEHDGMARPFRVMRLRNPPGRQPV